MLTVMWVNEIAKKEKKQKGNLNGLIQFLFSFFHSFFCSYFLELWHSFIYLSCSPRILDAFKYLYILDLII